MPDKQTVSHFQSIFNQKNHFDLFSFGSIQLSPILAIVMKIPKMAEIVYRQMPAPREIPQQIPAPQAKARMQKPQGGGKFLVKIPRGMVMAKIDTCIRDSKVWVAKGHGKSSPVG